MLKNGTDLCYTQQLLGHASSKTTEIYPHLTKRGEEKWKSPLDFLEEIKKKRYCNKEQHQPHQSTIKRYHAQYQPLMPPSHESDMGEMRDIFPHGI